MTTTKNVFKSVLLVAMILSLVSFDLPKGWFAAGGSPEKYEMGIDKSAGQDGKNVATIKSISQPSFDLLKTPPSVSIANNNSGFGTLMQECKASKYSGKKIKMSASVKSENVADWAGLWLRVDQAGSKEPLAFDNMQDRAIKGTTAWKKYEIVLDVPSNATILAYGALLAGTGQIWFANITFEVVGNSKKTTGSNGAGKESYIQAEPTNLDFAK